MGFKAARSSNRKAAPISWAGFQLEGFEPRQMLSANTVITPNLVITPARKSHPVIDGITPAQIKAAYGFKGIKADGTGQTIAIVDAFNDPAIAADLAVFSKQFGLPAASLTVVNQAGGSVRHLAVDTGWAGEIALDVEWAHAIAPGAKILLVETTTDDESNLMAGVNFARSVKGVSVVSTSWGESEASTDLNYDSYFTTPAGHTGVTFVSASGDEGQRYGPEFPASSANVLAVGGTTLTLTSSGAIASETAWRDSTGGTSLFETAPAYQTAITGNTARTTPDVAYAADPNNGFAVYDSIADQGTVGWQVIGGTSAGTPQWAGIIALADQARVAAGSGTLDGGSQTLPTLYALYGGASTSISYASSFNDITSGGGRGFGGRFGGFGGGSSAARTGYDTVTGLGTPKVAAVLQALVASTAKAAAAAPTSGRHHHVTAAAVHKSSVTLAEVDAAFDTSVPPGVAYSATTLSRSSPAADITQVTATATPNPGSTSGAVAGRLGTIVDPFLRRLASVATGDVIQSSVVMADAIPGVIAATPGAAKVATATLDVLQSTAAVAHFPHFDPAVMFNDLMGAFVNESTGVVAVVQGDATTWATAVTVAVLGLDAVLLARWFSRARSPQTRRTGREALAALDPL